MIRLTVNERDCWANARDAQIDADTLRQQAARARQPRKAKFLAEAEAMELQSARWVAAARIAQSQSA